MTRGAPTRRKRSPCSVPERGCGRSSSSSSLEGTNIDGGRHCCTGTRPAPPGPAPGPLSRLPGHGGCRGSPHSRIPHSPAPQQGPAPRRPPLQLPPPLRAPVQRRPQRRRRPARPTVMSRARGPARPCPSAPVPLCPSPSPAARRQHQPEGGRAAAPAGPFALPGPAGGACPRKAGAAPALRVPGGSRVPLGPGGCRAGGSLCSLCLSGAGGTVLGITRWARGSRFSPRCLRRFPLFPTPSKGARAPQARPTARGTRPLPGSGQDLFPSALAVERPENTEPPALRGWSPPLPQLAGEAGPSRARVSARTTFSPADTAHGKRLPPPLVCTGIKENSWGILLWREESALP